MTQPEQKEISNIFGLASALPKRSPATFSGTCWLSGFDIADPITNLAELLVHQGLPRMPELQGKIQAKKNVGGLGFSASCSCSYQRNFIEGRNETCSASATTSIYLAPPYSLALASPRMRQSKGPMQFPTRNP